jgi:hypothetical protein
LQLGFDLSQQLFKPLANDKRLENVLFLLDLDRQVRGDGVGQSPGIIDAIE